ncbi:MAG: acyl-CoA thioesterase [Candidatus Marsarchaeota archaeon]|nr:acyl-CoA thioesterase [Candidatus Marsarchaeota archaeon]
MKVRVGARTDRNSSVSMGDTAVEAVYLVNPGDANPIGILHGGNMMNWMVSTATLAVSRLSNGNAVLGSLDSIFFVSPVRVGQMVHIRSWVEYVGSSSAEVAVQAVSEDPVTGKSATTTLSHMAFVAVDSRGEPRPIQTKIAPSKKELGSYGLARRRWLKRRRTLSDRVQKSLDLSPYAADSEWRLDSSKIVFDDDALYGELMFAGRLLRLLDELTGVVATRYSKGAVVTGCVDDMSFYYPIRVGDILTVSVALNFTGNTTLELGAKIFCEDPFTGRKRHAATSYYTFVHIDPSGSPSPVPPYIPRTAGDKMRWESAKRRMYQRKRKLHSFRNYIMHMGDGYAL